MHSPTPRWSTPPRPTDPPEERPSRILIVDNGGHVRDWLGMPLRDAGYEIVTCSSVAALPATLDRVEPDLLLLDAALAEVSSFEVCGELRATEIGRETPIMLLATRAPDQDTIARGLLCGADDFCTLPDRVREVLARVRVQLRNKRDRDRLRRVRRERDSYRREATADALTGIPNRRSVQGAIATAVSSGAPFAVLFLDIDHFKSINDTFGHETGDHVLKAVAGALARSVRGADRYGRFGGEEFVVLISDINAELAVTIAERHRRAIEALRLPVLGGRAVTVSVGVAHFDPMKPDASDAVLVRRADMALYEAKRRGRNRVVLAPGELPPIRIVSPVPAAPNEKTIEQALLDKLSSGLAGLPLLAEAAAEALRLAGDAHTDISRIAKLVDRDPPLAARFVAVATSAVYAGRASKAATTQQALVRIGLASARDLLYQVVYERSGSDLPRYRREVTQSFHRSVRTALAARALTSELEIDFPYAYLAGLLHDIGEARVYRILAQMPTAPDDAKMVAHLVEKHHTRAGAGIAEAWQLPPAIVDACASHHGDPATVSRTTRLVMAADVLVRLCDASPILDAEDVERLVATGVRPDRVRPLVDGLASTLSEAEPPAAVTPRAAAAGGRR
jgi:diguanylate cyclase (GGDEF)-like protein/putative nucleotidyltransferase with HDIG domain